MYNFSRINDFLQGMQFKVNSRKIKENVSTNANLGNKIDPVSIALSLLLTGLIIAYYRGNDFFELIQGSSDK